MKNQIKASLTNWINNESNSVTLLKEYWLTNIDKLVRECVDCLARVSELWEFQFKEIEQFYTQDENDLEAYNNNPEVVLLKAAIKLIVPIGTKWNSYIAEECSAQCISNNFSATFGWYIYEGCVVLNINLTHGVYN